MLQTNYCRVYPSQTGVPEIGLDSHRCLKITLYRLVYSSWCRIFHTIKCIYKCMFKILQLGKLFAEISLSRDNTHMVLKKILENGYKTICRRIPWLRILTLWYHLIHHCEAYLELAINHIWVICLVYKMRLSKNSNWQSLFTFHCFAGDPDRNLLFDTGHTL